jgi:four helix bundle protein
MYKNMIIWQQSVSMVLFIYSITNLFPKEESFGLKAQMRRSSISLPSNIAEGKGRRGDKALLYFLRITLGSLFELETQVYLAYKLKYIQESELHEFNKRFDSLSKMISVIIKKLKAKS